MDLKSVKDQIVFFCLMQQIAKLPILKLSPMQVVAIQILQLKLAIK